MGKRMMAALLLVSCALATAWGGEALTRDLRGFGKVRAEFSQVAGGSVLSLEAASPAAAKLWQVKFLEDLSSTTGGAKEQRVGDFYAWRVASGGLFAAVAAFGMTGLVEWVFHLCNPMTALLLLSAAPLFVNTKKELYEETV